MCALFNPPRKLPRLLLLGSLLTLSPQEGAAQPQPAAVSEDALYRQYQVSNLNLQPLAQIEAWLGYLRMHPQTPHRDSIRWRLRYLAATLSPTDEERLLALLAYQQLPDLLVGLESRALQQQAAADYIQRHPILMQMDAYARSYVRLLDRLGVEDPVVFIARAQGKALPEKATAPTTASATTASATTALATAGPASNGAGAPGALPETAAQASITASATSTTGMASTGVSSSGAPRTETTAASPTASGTPGAVAALPSAVSSETGTQGATPTASAAATGSTPNEQGHFAEPSATSAVPHGETTVALLTPPSQAPLSEHEKETLRYPRWQAATAPLSPESRLQLWSTYLLLYPETAHLPEISAALQAAQGELEAQKRAQLDEKRTLAEGQQLNRELQARVEQLETSNQVRRAVLGAIGGSLLLLILVGIAGAF